MLAHKYAEFGSARVIADPEANHGRVVARSFVQNVADAVASVALAKKQDWEYASPELEEPPAAVAISLDGTCLLLAEDGWREAMVGSISLYDRDGQRRHTIDLGAGPEYGKQRFFDRLDREIDRVKAAYPEATCVGLADGARENWLYLDLKTSVQVVDFYHATQYLRAAADPLFPEDATGLRPWIDEWCHRLRHEPGTAEAMVVELETRGAALGRKRLPAEVESALTYFRNRLKGGRMDYAALAARGIPIGTGVTEAACKVRVKQRLCGSGMRWKDRYAETVLSLRALTYTAGRWEQFWAKLGGEGFPVAA